ncbi:MAG: restriction endonuclease [Helicobacteraceae bacterium]|jgi:hypothetical protein|nr:restriction endonuclease [Helicobacteraceae bacterium]
MDYIIGGIVVAVAFAMVGWIIKLNKEIIAKLATIKNSQGITQTTPSRTYPQKTAHDYSRDYEISVGRQFYNNGYTVYFTGLLKGKNDRGIDLVAEKGDEIVLIQCKYWKDPQLKVNDKVARVFNSDYSECIEQHSLDDANVHGVLAIPAEDTLLESGRKFFDERSPKLRYEVIAMDKDLWN